MKRWACEQKKTKIKVCQNIINVINEKKDAIQTNGFILYQYLQIAKQQYNTRKETNYHSNIVRNVYK